MELIKEAIINNTDKYFVIFDKKSSMFYKKPFWIKDKYKATRLTEIEADYEIRCIYDLYDEFLKNMAK